MITPIMDSISINDGRSRRNFNIEYPSKCPICKGFGKPTCLYSAYIENSEHLNFDNPTPDLFVVFFCSSCNRVFIGNYLISYERNPRGCRALSFEPNQTPNKKQFPSNIEELSPDFCQIYNQAYAAQQNSLDSISGMGYRKALEFLVKDYAISNTPAEETRIVKLPLAKCINQYIENDRIRKLALASAWLGNDETHYERKNSQYSVGDLIAFIDAMVSFIDYELSVNHAATLLSRQNENIDKD